MPLVWQNVSLYIIVLIVLFKILVYINFYICHSIIKLASNNGKPFFSLTYGKHKGCCVICPLTKHLNNHVNALKECRSESLNESNQKKLWIESFWICKNCTWIENLWIESIHCLPKDSQPYSLVCSVSLLVWNSSCLALPIKVQMCQSKPNYCWSGSALGN